MMKGRRAWFDDTSTEAWVLALATGCLRLLPACCSEGGPGGTSPRPASHDGCFKPVMQDTRCFEAKLNRHGMFIMSRLCPRPHLQHCSPRWTGSAFIRLLPEHTRRECHRVVVSGMRHQPSVASPRVHPRQKAFHRLGLRAWNFVSKPTSRGCRRPSIQKSGPPRRRPTLRCGMTSFRTCSCTTRSCTSPICPGNNIHLPSVNLSGTRLAGQRRGALIPVEKGGGGDRQGTKGQASPVAALASAAAPATVRPGALAPFFYPFESLSRGETWRLARVLSTSRGGGRSGEGKGGDRLCLNGLGIDDEGESSILADLEHLGVPILLDDDCLARSLAVRLFGVHRACPCCSAALVPPVCMDWQVLGRVPSHPSFPLLRPPLHSSARTGK